MLTHDRAPTHRTLTPSKRPERTGQGAPSQGTEPRALLKTKKHELKERMATSVESDQDGSLTPELIRLTTFKD